MLLPQLLCHNHQAGLIFFGQDTRFLFTNMAMACALAGALPRCTAPIQPSCNSPLSGCQPQHPPGSRLGQPCGSFCACAGAQQPAQLVSEHCQPARLGPPGINGRDAGASSIRVPCSASSSGCISQADIAACGSSQRRRISDDSACSLCCSTFAGTTPCQDAGCKSVVCSPSTGTASTNSASGRYSNNNAF